MPVDDQDIRALTYIARRIRQETRGAGEWDEVGTHAVISRFKGHSLTITIERVTRHAGDAEARTPGAMERPFTPPAPVAGVRHPVKAGEDCRIHVGEERHACRLCAVDGIRHPGDPTPTEDTEDGRALLEEIRARRELTDRPDRPEGDAS
jgi:hypothetical protein